MIQQVNSEQSGYNMSNQSRFFKINGYATKMMNDERMVYMACPDCKKKVTDEAAGYRCETCGKIQ